MSPPSSDLQDRFRGALLGTLVGDALGMPVEGWSANQIRMELGEVRDMLPARQGSGTFTDDTQMTVALAEALLSMGDATDPDPGVFAEHFAHRYDPARGYGANAGRMLADIKGGRPWRKVVADWRLPGGSFANGAAMRVAPVALASYPDPAAAARLSDAQAMPTGHDHPEARFGARLQAVAVQSGLTSPRNATPADPFELLELASLGWDGDPPRDFSEALGWIAQNRRASATEAASFLGTGLRAAESVPAAIWSFLAHPDDFEGALITAVGLGGDTDTIAAMTGSLVGARTGASAIPRRWMDAVETGPQGASGLIALADRFYHRLDRAPAGPDTPAGPQPG